MSDADGEWAAMDDPASNVRGRPRYPPVLTTSGTNLLLSTAALEEMGDPDRVTFYESEDGRIRLAAGGGSGASRSVVNIPTGGGSQVGYADLARRLTEDGGSTRYRLTHDPDAGLWVLDPEEPWEPGDGDE